NISNDGGNNFTSSTLDRIGGGDDAAVRVAVNGGTAYAVFTRLNSVIEENDLGTSNSTQVIVVRSDNGGGDGFTALGAGGNGVEVARTITVDGGAVAFNTVTTLGQQRSGSDTAIAVDPTKKDHVLVAYTDSRGSLAAGVRQMVVSESFDGGATWTEKFRT